uniref:Molybdenum cofactor sulfurase n=1 Tax=Kalanchoe fedtschenkoi TaxID=63787 RepID=A0A7N0RCW4_KALFE
MLSCCGAFCLCASDPPCPGAANTSAVCRQQFRAATGSVFGNSTFTNHESLPSLEDSYSQLLRFYPQYSETEMVDRIRDGEYRHLNQSNHVCLDYNGVGLFSYSQVHDQEPAADVASSSSSSNYLGVPMFNISCKSTSLKMQLLRGGRETKLESAIKRRIMDYLGVLEDEYSMVFTANRASAFKLLAESYPFQTSRKLLTVYDYKSEAVEEMIRSSRKRGAETVAAEFVWPRLKICTSKLKKKMVKKTRNKKPKGLFAFPLQSRVTGARYPCLWMSIAKENGWHILFDACALGLKEMNCFGLSLYQPDFIICSFYKVFGDNPSGFGCLFVKKSTISILEASATSSIVSLVPPGKKPLALHDEFESTSNYAIQEDDTDTSCSFSGPIIFSASQSVKTEQGGKSEARKVEDSKPKGVLHASEIEEMEKQPASVSKVATSAADNEHSRFECRGLDHVDTLGLRVIGSRARYLINWLVIALRTLHHPNTEPKIPLVRIYGPKIKFDRSPALAFNIFDWKGAKVEPTLVQKLADRSNISISYAFLQHIQFPNKYRDEKERITEGGSNQLEDTEATKTKHETYIGIKVITAQLGFLTNFEDTYRLWAFVAQFLNADFVEKERWRYTSLNQNTVEI